MNEYTDGSTPGTQGGDRSDAGAAPGEDGQSPSLLARLFGWHEEDESADRQGGSEAPSPAGQLTGQLAVNLREMRGKRVDDVSIPRADIVAVPDDMDPTQLIEVFRKSAMTRIPVYHETLDDPLGLLHFKDFALRHGFGNGHDSFNIRSMLRPMLYVPASMPIFSLLQKMQRERCHMALVIDEYGGVDGLVTFEDVVEQIVGEIEDEHDIEDPVPWRQESPDVFLTSARAELADFAQATGIDLMPGDVDEEIDTLGGLVFVLSGRVPELGEVIMHPDGHDFEVVEADARHIKRMRVRLRRAGRLDRAAE